MRAKSSLWIGSAVSALAALVELPPAAAAAAGDCDLAVTIYANGTALIQDHRSINVSGGRQRLDFQNVSAQIQPETVSLAAEGISSYLTQGLGWKADYVALYNEADSKLDAQGWITLTNSSGTTYDDARTVLVASSPGGESASQPNNWTPRRPQPRPTLVQPGTETGPRERLGDAYLYPIAERTTLANLQTKQVSFLDVHGVPAEHAYEFRNPLARNIRTAAKRTVSLSLLHERQGRPG